MKTIHQSDLDQLLRCGVQFEFRRIKGIIMPPSISASRGHAVHKAVETNELYKKEGRPELLPSDIEDIAVTEYKIAISDGIFLPKEQQSEKRKQLEMGLVDSVRCSKKYLSVVSPMIDPIEVEKKFEIDFPNVSMPISGQMDIINRNHCVDDIKTTTTKWSDDRVNESIQPILYSYAYEKIYGQRPDWKYHILIARQGKTGNPTSTDYQPLSLKIRDTHYDSLSVWLILFERAIQSGIFLPANPMSWWCSSKWCGYWQICKYHL